MNKLFISPTAETEVEETSSGDIRPGETDENGVCLMNCGRYGLKSLWCRHCEYEFTGEVVF